jgi:cytochrome c peroxidase
MHPRPLLAIALAALLSFLITSCGSDKSTSPKVDEVDAIIQQFGLGPLPPVPYPDNNHFNAERIALGRLLFFDPILGGESAPWIKSAAGKDPYRYRANDIACATCHHPRFGFADGRRLGAGVGGAQFRDTDLGPDRVVPGVSLVTGDPVGTEPRNSPTVINAACNGKNSPDPVAESFQFMDGRVTKGLDEQATFPITSREEMAGDAYNLPPGLSTAEVQAATRDSVVARLRDIPEYVERFKQAFPQEVHSGADMNIDQVGRAIGAYERELVTPDSRYDQFLRGHREVFTAQELEGFKLFFGKGDCGDCHRGTMLSDFTFRVIGVADDYDAILPGFAGKNGQGGDWGRFHADPVAFADQKFAFRVPTIRNLELTAPYFHSGSAGTLRQVVEFYNRGGQGPQDISDATLAAEGAVRDTSIVPLGLTGDEIDAIVAFMRTASGPVQSGPLGVNLTEVPERVPSGLLPPGVATPAGPGPFYATRPALALK